MLFTTTIGRLLQESAQSVGGTASDEIAGDGTPGAATVTASVTLSDGTEISGSITVQTSSDSPNIQLLAADGSLAAAVELRAAETEQITAEVLDWDGTAISGVGVAFESTALSIDTTSGVTDSNGRVTVTLSGTETQEDGTLTAAATFSSFDLSAEIVARSLGVNTESNRITLDAIDLGTDGVLDGNEKVQIVANVLEDGLVKDGISVVFTAGTLTLTPTSATSAGGGIATVQLTGDGMAGTAEVTVSATLSNGISVTDSQTIQTTEVTPSIDLVIRDQSGVSITTYGANQEMTLELTILDHDGSALDTDDAGVSVTFDVGNLGTVTNTESVTEFEVCPTNLIPELTDCAFVGFTSNSTAVVGEITVTATINGIVITDIVLVTNTGINSGSPSQENFSITRKDENENVIANDDTFALEGDQFNGEIATIEVEMGDYFSNPVPDGTLVEFRAELGLVEKTCETVSGVCSVIYTSADPRTPIDTEVSFRNLTDDNCPSTLIIDERVTIASGNALTDYRVSSVKRVANTGGTAFAANTYTAFANGIECLLAPCSNGIAVDITYERLWLDEVDDASTNHFISNPGEATEPFLDATGTPCLAGVRDALEVITGSINPNGTTAVTGVGTVFELELVAGDRLKVRNEVRTITGIAGNTSLTVDTAFSDGDNDVSPKRVAAPGYLGGMGQPLVPWVVLPSILMIRARPVVVYIQVLLPLARIPVALHQWS